MGTVHLSTADLPLSYINALDIGKRSRGAAIGLLFYDHLTNLDREIQLVWTKPKWSPGFFLYIFNRLFAFFYYIWDTIPTTPDGTNTSLNCAIFLACDGIVTLIATLLVQIILQLRIYALYERNQKILMFLLAFCAMEVGAMVVLVAVTLSRLKHLPIASTDTGCAYEGLLKLSALFWLPGLVFEPVLFAMVAYKSWGNDNKVPLISRMARESLVYFIAIFAELMISTFIWAYAPEYINIVNPWSAALPSLLGSKLLLRMREASEKRRDGSYLLESYAVLKIPL